MKLAMRFVAGLAAALCAGLAGAQAWPTKPVPL
jgi:hypothetical protein